MTTSDYLKIQAALLIAVEQLRHLPLREFLQRTEEVQTTGQLVDHGGFNAMTDSAAMQGIARCASEMISYGPHSLRKPAAREDSDWRVRREKSA